VATLSNLNFKILSMQEYQVGPNNSRSSLGLVFQLSKSYGPSFRRGTIFFQGGASARDRPKKNIALIIEKQANFEWNLLKFGRILSQIDFQLTHLHQNFRCDVKEPLCEILSPISQPLPHLH
jgi:hypothetical protein